MASQKKNIKLNQLLTDLKSSDEKVISKSIKALEKHGNSSVIRPVCELLLTDLSDKNRQQTIEFLSSLKDSSTCVELMDVINDEKFSSVRQVLLTTIWNTKVDFSGYIDDFVLIATKGSFLETLDCLTIIENLEGPFMEEDLLECQLHLKNYLEDDSPKDMQKAELLSEIAIFIKKFNEELMD
jgi:hypothetical protein